MLLEERKAMDGKRLRQLRTHKKLTQEELGKIINVSKVSISGYENGTRTPDTDNLRRLADYFDVDADYLLGRSSEPKQKERKKTDDPLTNLMFDGWDEMDEETKREALDYIEYLKEKKKKK